MLSTLQYRAGTSSSSSSKQQCLCNVERIVAGSGTDTGLIWPDLAPGLTLHTTAAMLSRPFHSVMMKSRSMLRTTISGMIYLTAPGVDRVTFQVA